MYWIPIFFIALLVLTAFLGGGNQGKFDDEDCSLDTHRMNGAYRVLYNDGYLSQPFYANTAKFYAKHFGGRVVSRNYNGPYKKL